MITLAITGLESVDDAELREFVYRFFGQIATVYSEELSPVYPVGFMERGGVCMSRAHTGRGLDYSSLSLGFLSIIRRLGLRE